MTLPQVTGYGYRPHSPNGGHDWCSLYQANGTVICSWCGRIENADGHAVRLGAGEPDDRKGAS